MRPLRWSHGAIAVTMLTLAALALASTGSAFAEVTGAADNLRTGWYPDEPSLTPELLKSTRFEQAFKTPLTGQIYAQPLVANGTLLVATEDNRVYGLDPLSGKVLWEKQFGTAVNAEESPIECGDLSPHIGITGTPVIDTEKNVAYFVSNRYVTGTSGEMAWYMHAISLSSGDELSNFPVRIEGEAQNLPKGVKFDATQQLQRPALLLMNGIVYAGFGSHCDNPPWEGWLVGVSTSGQLKMGWATGANAGGIWQSGGGLVSDAPGQILFATGNGATAEGNPTPGKSPLEGRLSDSVIRVEVQHETELRSTDFFSPFDNAVLSENDLDLGSGAPMALPSQYFGTASVPHLLVEQGKDGYLYLLNRDSLGGMGQGPGGKDEVVQKLGPFGGVWDSSAVWPGEGGYLYTPAVSPAGTTTENGDHLRFFKYGLKAGEPAFSLAATSPDIFGFGSGSPIVTSNATTSGSALVWITHCPPPERACPNSELRAYSPVPVENAPQELWKAAIGQGSKFSRPYASNGHVYVGNREGDIFAYSGPSLTPSPSSLELGTVSVGGQPKGEVTFANSGTQLKVSAVHPPSAPFEASGLPAVGSSIEPGQVITVKVTFRPTAPGSFKGSLGLTTQAGEINIALLGSTPPVVTSIEPAQGPSSGGTAVKIKGSSFLKGATVTIGSETSAVEVLSEQEIKATTAATNAGPAEVVVSDANGTSTEGPTYTYIAPPTVETLLPQQGPGSQWGLPSQELNTPPAPTIANPIQSNSTWSEGNKLATFSRKKTRIGTTFSFTLNEQASVSFAFTQQVGGRKVNGKCVAKANKNRHQPSCKRTVTRGTLTFTGHDGTNKVSFQGRISASKKLPLGRYKLVVIATNAAGQRSSPKSLSFTIVK
jgi:outer membrane protein assembly factor BamB